jgi:hypothetical protein
VGSEEEEREEMRILRGRKVGGVGRRKGVQWMMRGK